jgi:hypothetical protein
MLTKIRRQLARDGLVMWRVHAMVPPRVDYSLTPIGEQLGESVCGVWLWVEAHMEEMRRARRSTTRLGSDQRRQLVGPAQKLIAGLLANAEDAEISNSPAVSRASDAAHSATVMCCAYLRELIEKKGDPSCIQLHACTPGEDLSCAMCLTWAMRVFRV